MPEVLAVDIGGTKIAAALVEGSKVLTRRQAPTPAADGPEGVITALLELVDDWLPRSERLQVAVTGLVRQGTVTALNQKSFPGWQAYPLQEDLRRRSGLEVGLLNDAHAAAWGEHRFGAGRGCHDLVFVTISTGIGGGLILNDRLVTGSTGLAGHLGFTLSQGAATGHPEILEARASGTAVGKLASLHRGRPVTAREVFACAWAGERWAGGILDQAAAELARALADLKVLIEPECILIGGGVGLARGFAERIQAALQTFPMLYQLPVRRAMLGADAGLIGVAAWEG